jgi:hypothetical protein
MYTTSVRFIFKGKIILFLLLLRNFLRHTNGEFNKKLGTSSKITLRRPSIFGTRGLPSGTRIPSNVLQSIEKSVSPKLETINPLSNLQYLTSLTLGGKFNQSLSFSLSNLKNLTSLTLVGDFNQDLSSSLIGLTGLTNLTIGEKMTNINKTNLQDLTSLTNLTINGDIPLKDRTNNYWLSDLPKLTNLTLDGIFNQPIGDSLLGLNLTNLTFGI